MNKLEEYETIVGPGVIEEIQLLARHLPETLMPWSPDLTREFKTPIIYPALDPFSDRNKDLSPATLKKTLHKYGIKSGAPILTQVSRFDDLKALKEVIQIYQLAKKNTSYQLILAGTYTQDNKNETEILSLLKNQTQNDPDIHIIPLNKSTSSDLEINALQWASDIVLQKSLVDDFGLTVAQALWKSKPVIASPIGGIPFQIIHAYTGFISHTLEGTAYYIRHFQNHPTFAERLGKNGHEHIRQNFLITTELRDHLLLLHSLVREGDLIWLE